MPHRDYTTWVYWLESILQRGHLLTPWEIEFTESIQTKMDHYGPETHLSEYQIEKLEQIYNNRAR